MLWLPLIAVNFLSDPVVRPIDCLRVACQSLSISCLVASHAVLRWVCDKLATTGLVDALSLLRGDDARIDYAWRIPHSDYTI